MPTPPKTKKKPHGGQIKLNPVRMSKFLTAVATGNFISTAAQFAGVTPNTVRNWEARGENEIERVKASNPDIEQEIAEWTDNYSNDYKATNPIFTDKGLPAINPAEWQFVLFISLTKAALARAEVNAVGNIRRAASRDWRADAWWLERTRGEKFGRKDTLGIEGTDGNPVRIELPPVSEIAARIAKLKEKDNGL